MPHEEIFHTRRFATRPGKPSAVSWIEAHCRCPEGAPVGQPIELMRWQKDAIRKIYDNSRGHSAGDRQRRQKIRKDDVRSMLPPRLNSAAG